MSSWEQMIVSALTSALVSTILGFLWMVRPLKALERELDREFEAKKSELEKSLKELEMWHKERQQLLDRIQSPSFAEYKQAEVKIIKAQNGEKDPPKIEVM